MSLPLEVQHTFKPTRILPASPIRNSYCPDHLARACPVHLLRRSLVIFIVISYCTDYQKETLDNSRCPSPVKKVLLESSLPPDSCLQQTCGRIVSFLGGLHLKTLLSLFSPLRDTILGSFHLLLSLRGRYNK